jgi:regulator of PEP synthase PpsR (kinase-PPPase family)
VIDVTRRSVEESAAQILKLMHDRQAGMDEVHDVGEG